MPASIKMLGMPKPNTRTAIHAALDFKGFDDFVELFKAGDQTDSQGTTRNFSTDDLDDMVRNHQAAPIVIGHPKVDAPAYGWTSELKRDGDTLLGKFSNVEPQFADMVENKRFPNRSVRLRNTDNGLQVAHVGWLGAVPPAIDGLKQVEFASADDGIEIEFSGYSETISARLFRGLREFIIEKFSKADADSVLSEWDLQALADDAVREQLEDSAETSPQFNKKPINGGEHVPTPKTYTEKEISDLVAEGVAAATADFSTSNKKLLDDLSAERKTRLTAEYSTFIDTLVGAGKLKPADAAGAVDFMLQLSVESEFEFSQGEGDKKTETKTTAVDWFKDFVSGLGKTVPMGQLADDDLDDDVTDYSAPDGITVDADRLALDRKARTYMRANNCDYIEAVVAVGG